MLYRLCVSWANFSLINKLTSMGYPMQDVYQGYNSSTVTVRAFEMKDVQKLRDSLIKSGVPHTDLHVEPVQF